MNRIRLKFGVADRFAGFSRHAETFASSRKRKKIKGVGDSGIVRRTFVFCLFWIRLTIRTQKRIGIV